ncbi:MAG: hypothetical protein LBJ11_06635, partial [Oscillospiraceae bacterium]|nr:hypothetical protein [Oscillospiraceae bacterium]
MYELKLPLSCDTYHFVGKKPTVVIFPDERVVTARKKRGKISRKKREPEEAEGREEKQAQRAYKREAKM